MKPAIEFRFGLVLIRQLTCPWRILKEFGFTLVVEFGFRLVVDSSPKLVIPVVSPAESVEEMDCFDVVCCLSSSVVATH